MPSQSGPAPISVGAALRKSATTPAQARQDFADLPPGIQGGVAVLAKAVVGTFKESEENKKAGRAGQRFIQLTAAVQSPQEHTWSPKRFVNGALAYDPPTKARVFGRQFSKLLPLCAETRKIKGELTQISAAENVDNALNELKLLAGNDCCASLAKLPANATTAQENAALSAILGAMVKAGIKFGFDTRAKEPSAQYPEPGSWPPDWKTPLGPATNGQVPVGHVDNTEEVIDAPEGQEEPAADAPAEEPAADEPTEDIEALVAAANAQDNNAKVRLIALAVEAGNDKDAVEALETWEEVAALIVPTEEPEAEAEPEVEEPPPWKPAKGEVYGYKPVTKNKAGKLVAGKAVDCKVGAVDETSEKADLLNTVDKKTVYKGVKWSALIRE